MVRVLVFSCVSGGCWPSAAFLGDGGLFVWVSVLAGGLGSFVAQKFVVRLPSFWGGFLCGLVLGEFCCSRRGVCLEHFRDVGRLV